MILLRTGDRSATVAMLQVMLNCCNGQTALEPDGHFGRQTAEAVRQFQRSRNLSPSGVFDPRTWSAMRSFGNYAIVDIVDMAYSEALRIKGGPQNFRTWCQSRFRELYPNKPADEVERTANQYINKVLFEADYNGGFFQRMQALGGNPVAVTDPYRAFSQITAAIRERSRNTNIVLIRFQGHGGSEAQGIAGSVEGLTRMTRLDIFQETLLPGSRPVLEGNPAENHPRMIANIRSQLMPWAAVEMHGCHVGGERLGGRYVSSTNNLSDYANFFMLPVTGSPASQIWNSTRNRTADYRLEGPVISVVPLGSTLSWFNLMSRRSVSTGTRPDTPSP